MVDDGISSETVEIWYQHTRNDLIFRGLFEGNVEFSSKSKGQEKERRKRGWEKGWLE